MHFISKILASLLCILLAASPAGSGSMTLLGAGKAAAGGFTPSCTESGTFLARTSGLSTTERNAYDAMICGMVTDGVWAKLDALYIFATKDTTTAALNLVSTNFNLTTHGTPTSFTADVGYTGDGSTFYLDTGFVPNAGGHQLTQNSASVGVYVRNNRTSADGSYAIGTHTAFSNTEFVSISPYNSGLPAALFGTNDTNSPFFNAGTAQGNWIASRTGASAGAAYRNGSSVVSIATTATGLSDDSIYIFAINTFSPSALSSDQISSAFFGAGLSSGDQTAVASRINGYMTALGINVY